MKKTTNIVNVDNNGEVKVGVLNRIWTGCKNHKIGVGLIVAAGAAGVGYLLLTSDKGEDAANAVADSIEKTVETVSDAISK